MREGARHMGHYVSEIIGTSYHNHKHWARIVCGNEQESLAQITSTLNAGVH